MELENMFDVPSFVTAQGVSVQIKMYGDAERPAFAASQIGALLGIHNIRASIQNFADGHEKCNLVIDGCNQHGLTEKGFLLLVCMSATDTAWLLTCWLIKMIQERHQKIILETEILRLKNIILQLELAKSAAKLKADTEALARKLQIISYLQTRLDKEKDFGDFVIKGQSMLCSLKTYVDVVDVGWTISLLSEELSVHFIDDHTNNQVTGIEKLVEESKYCPSGLYSVRADVLQEYLTNVKDSCLRANELIQSNN